MNRQRAEFSHGATMPPVGPSLKKLRLSAMPPLSIRQMAEKLGMGHSSYNFYENPNTFKKPNLPIDFARKVAVVLAEYGVDPIEVMKLAGLKDFEAEPDVRAIDAQRPLPVVLQMSVVLPNEAVLTQMFDTLLSLLPADTPRPDVAKFLAQRLGSGFAGLGSLMPAAGSVAWTEGEVTPPTPAKDHPAPEQQSHI